jgi:thiamine-phosphate pyrophosphorylase
MKNFKDNSLYMVTSEEYSNGRGSLDVSDAAIKGGVDILQMREKHLSREELGSLGRRLSLLCGQNEVIFIVNDDPYMALEVDADGVHVGQEDIKKYPVKKTREILGDDKIIGLSTHSLDQFKEANGSDCDYIAYGPIFHTKTKDYAIGTENIREVLKMAKKPVFFIGGIDLTNIDAVLREGARNVAVIRAIAQAENITEAARDLKRRIGSSEG